MADHDHETDSPAAPAEIVQLADAARPAVETRRFQAVARLESYWQALRGTRLVPARSEVQPREIADCLDVAFVLERVAPGMARFRLAGMHLSDLMGMEVRGMPLSSFFVPEARNEVSTVLERVFDDPAIVRMRLTGDDGHGRPWLDGRLLLMPMTNDFGDVSRALGCLSTNGQLGRVPRRFTVAESEVVPIIRPAHQGDRRIAGWSRGMARQRARTPMRGWPGPAGTSGPPRSATQPPPASPQPPRRSGAEGRPHLYLVTSND